MSTRAAELVFRRVLEHPHEREVLADQDAEESAEHGDDLEDEPARAGRGHDGETDEEADAPRDEADLVVGPLDDQAPDDAADDGRDEAGRQRRKQGCGRRAFLANEDRGHSPSS